MAKPKALRPLRHGELLAVLRSEVDRYASDAAAARALGVTRGHLSRVLREEKPITPKLAELLGYERQWLFVPYEFRE